MFDHLLERNENVKSSMESRLEKWPGCHKDFIGSMIIFVKKYEVRYRVYMQAYGVDLTLTNVLM